MLWQYVWKSEDNLQELPRSFHLVGSGAGAQADRLGRNYIYLLSSLIDLIEKSKERRLIIVSHKFLKHLKLSTFSLKSKFVITTDKFFHNQHEGKK